MSSGCCGSDKQKEMAGADASSAIEILRVRFAKGEIDKAEFEERRQVLAEAPAPGAAAKSGKACC